MSASLPITPVLPCPVRRLVPTSGLMHCLFNHLISDGEHTWGNGPSESSRGLEVQHQFEFGRLFNRQFGRLRALQDLVDITGAAAKQIRQTGAIRQQPSRDDVLANLEHPGNEVIYKEINDLLYVQLMEWIAGYDQRVR